MRPIVNAIGIGLFIIIIIVFSTKRLSTLAHPSEGLCVFLVHPSTSILRFEELGHACGGPNQSWITAYVAYDGNRLSLSSATYSSPSEASRRLQSRLQGAAKIQETGPKYNRQGYIVGERVGERVVAFFRVEEKEIATILLTQEKSLFAIETEVFNCALEFERTKVE